MRIIFLISSMGPGGAERVAATLCNAWAERGDNVTLVATFSGGGKAFYEISPSVEFMYLADMVGIKKKNVFNYVQRILALRRLISDRRPDVIVSFLANVNVTAVFSSAFLRIPLIVCERSDPSICPYPRLLTLLCKISYRFADVLAVQTESVAAKIVNVYPGLGMVRVIPNPLPEAIKTICLQSSPARKILLSLGRLSQEKQIDKLLKAFSEVAPFFVDWDLHIYGDGPLKTRLDEQIKDAKLNTRVKLKGSTELPWKVMARADAFVMVSAYEGFPNALLEAMGVGLPCIVFDCPSGPREITRDGKDAILIPLSDHERLVSALFKLMGDAGLRDALGAQARTSVHNRFCLSKVIQKWDLLFKEVGAVG